VVKNSITKWRTMWYEM